MHRIFAICGLVAIVSGCESDELRGTALLDVSPEAIDFGAVPSGESRTLELRLRNPSGAAPLKLYEVRLADGSATTFELSEAGDQIAPGAEVVLTVRYTPTEPEASAGEVLIRSNAVQMPVRTIPIRSAQTYPKISVQPGRLDLGSTLAGGAATDTLRIVSVGDARLLVDRLALRSGGFPGEPCTHNRQCRDSQCLPSRSGLICATDCNQDCATGYICTPTELGTDACLEGEGTRPPLSLRGFTVQGPSMDVLNRILPGDALELTVTYAPGPDDRGSTQLLVHSDDADTPTVIVALLGRPEDLPPIAEARLLGEVPDPVLPGTIIALSGTGSVDPEGEALRWQWRFLRRPQGSRATFVDPEAEDTEFTVDRPGRYVATLEVLDPSGQASTNDARVEVEAESGPAFEVELSWDRPGTDLDLHVVAPGGRIGALADCFFDNPTPDWGASGPISDPVFTSGLAKETVFASAPPDGVFTVVATIVAASPQGPTAATIRIRLGETEVAAYTTTLDVTAQAWDVATISWPSGRITDLDRVR